MDWKKLAEIEQKFLGHAQAAGFSPDDYLGMQLDPDGGVLLTFFNRQPCGDWEIENHYIGQAEAEALVANVGQRVAQHGDLSEAVIKITSKERKSCGQ